MDISSSGPGFSQLFVADGDQSFTEQRSTWTVITVGNNSVQFPLRGWRGTVGKELRWDPLDHPSEMTVTGIRLVSGLFSKEVPLSLLKPSLAVSEIVVVGSSATFRTESNDPQILIAADTESFVQQSIFRAASISLVASIVVGFLMWLYLRRRPVTDDTKRGVENWAASDKEAIQQIPLWTLGVVAALVVSGIALLVQGSRAIGISWDESIHELSLEEFFRSGWFIPRGSFVDAIPRLADASVYAPVGALLAHMPGAFGGVHPWFEASFTAGAYETRHVAVAAISMLGLVAIYLSARAIFGSWKWAFLTLAIGLSIPLLLGHSMFNIKDAPVAAAFSLYTLGLVLLSRHRIDRRSLVFALIAQTAGVFLGVGNRPGIWVGLMASAALTMILLAALDFRADGVQLGLRRGFLRIGSIATSAIVGFILLWTIYPIAFSNVMGILRDSLISSQEFPWSGVTLTAGTFMPAQPPWTYLPLWIGAQLPLLVSGAAALGIVWLIFTYSRDLVAVSVSDRLVRGSIPVFLQATVVPFGAIVMGSTLYGGVRQFLFIFPAIALLAALGIQRAVHWVKAFDRAWLVSLTWIVVLVGLAVPMWSQLRLFPYSFAYFNAAASVRDVEQNWDVDGWWLSGRELVEGQRFPARTICVDSDVRFISSCSRMGMITPYLGEPDDSAIQLGEDQYVALSRFPYSVGPDSCTPFREVTRGLFFQEVQFSHADVCTATLAPYPADGLTFAGLTKDDPVLLWGWNPYLLWGWGEPDANGVWMVEPEASVGFVLPEGLGTYPAEMAITLSGSDFAAADAVVRVFVNGRDAGTIPLLGDGQVETARITVPREAWEDLNDDRVVVRLQAEGIEPTELEDRINTGRPGLLRLESLELL